jgi:hypothetical protein
VGQGKPEFNEYARNFHDKIGRGNRDEPWPELILKNAPRHRLEMLDVYEPSTLKQQALV